MGVAFLLSIVYSVYLMVDTQMILGGKNKELALDDYVLGSVILYADIISLFLKILQILGKKKDDWWLMIHPSSITHITHISIHHHRYTHQLL